VPVVRWAYPNEKNPTLDTETISALATPIGRAFMLPEEWSPTTAPYFGTRGNLNTWLITERVAFDVGGSTSIRDIIMHSGGLVRDVYLDIKYSGGYIEVKTPSDEFKALVIEEYARIRDSWGANITYLAVVGHISGKLAPGLRIAKDFSFEPTIFNWMDVWESCPIPAYRSFPDWLLEEMFG
jgi:hypothetical protein